MQIYQAWLASCRGFKKMSFYAVASGRQPGIYKTWRECQEQVHQHSRPIYKKFKTLTDAEEFIKQFNVNLNTSVKDGNSLWKAFASKNQLQPTLPKEFFVCGKRRTIMLESVPTTSKRSATEISEGSTSNKSKKPKTANSNDQDISQKYKVTPEGFLLDEEGYVNVYTDGACLNNGKSSATAGIGVWWGDNHHMNVSRQVTGNKMTNNVAEIQAVAVAARQAKEAKIKKLKINTDSQFLIKCITEWIPKWKRTGWLRSTGEPVINKIDLIDVLDALNGLSIAWNHVNGHVGIHGNEMADALAKNGCCPK